MDKQAVLREQLQNSVKETEECILKCQKFEEKLDGGSKLTRKFIAEKRFLTKVNN
jgi:hypothetical protein